MTRPNLLMFMPDQLRADAVGCFGSPVARTPNIDALAARGVRFDHAYSQHSVCGPSRVSLMTGWYPHVAGHRTLTHLLKPWEPNMFQLLKDAGYHVAWAGERGDTFSPGVADAVCDQRGFDLPPQHLLSPSPFEAGDPWIQAHYHGQRKGSSAGGPTLDFDEAAVQTAIKWLTDGLPEPWVLFIALIFPHPPFVAEEPWFSMHDRSAMPEGAAWIPDGKPAYMTALRERTGSASFDTERWAEIAATYHGMVSRVDDQLGRVVDAVERTGQTDQTMTWFFTDHGEYLGDHGLVEKWPSGQHDCLLRNPLVVAGPGVAAGGVNTQMVELIDLLPTALELADHTAQHTHFGRSLVPLLDGSDTSHRELAFAEGGFLTAEEHLLERSGPPYDIKSEIQHDTTTAVGKVASVRDQRYTYVHRLYEGAELYDRLNDPGETVNLAGSVDHAKVVSNLKDAVLTWLLETSDVIPWTPDPRFEPSLIDLFRR